ncbi:DUF5011 domain-containing protein [Bifidobacterium sp. 82T10]|uniref:DUF5011 domain-containing protein n=1 Tax=Bifidobacterium miconis TaxID=2834435 RepID=A0ABS6WI48_9BIFI|nr:immunoglobulin-like domain-containing protein [Bifidobacterium miconis]MBW3093721.1 DUF5011 domain-containing protein [Bifidobacterium miconis]
MGVRYLHTGILGRVVGFVCALAMLLTGALVASPAYAAGESSGDVALDWNWDGHTPDGLDANAVVKGTRNGDDWTPDLQSRDENLIPAWGTVNGQGRYFYGWNSKADGTGDWYDFVENRVNYQWKGYLTGGLPKTADGAVKYPAGGKLYAQWRSIFSDYPVALSYTAETADEVKNLSLRAYLSNWKNLSDQRYFRGSLYVMACSATSCDRNSMVSLVPLRIPASGETTFTLKEKAAGNERALDDLLDNAFKNRLVTSLRISSQDWSNDPDSVAIIDLRKPADAKVNVPQSPKFNWVGSNNYRVELGSQFDPLKSGIKGYPDITATDAAGNDITSKIEVSGTVDTSKLGKYTVDYRVTDAQGYVATARRTVEVVVPSVPESKLTAANKVEGLVETTIKPAADGSNLRMSFILHPGKAYANTQVAFYAWSVNNVYRDPETVFVDQNGVADTGPVYNDGGFRVGENRVVVVPLSDPSKVLWDSFTLTDVKAPVIKGADDASVSLNAASFDPTAGVTASDETDGDLTKSLSITGKVDTTKPGLYELNYTVSDKVGHKVRWSRVVNVVPAKDSGFTQENWSSCIVPNDPLRPGVKVEITVACPDASSRNKVRTAAVFSAADGDAVSGLWPGATVGVYLQRKGVSDGSGRVTLADKATVSAQGTVTVKVPENVTPADYYLAVTYQGGMKWNSLTVEPKENPKPTPDTTKPVIAGAADVTIDQNAKFDPLSGVTAKDETDGDLTKGIKVEGTVDTAKPGEYKLTYTVADKAGNTATVTRVVTVKAKSEPKPDTTKPVIAGAADVTIDQNAKFDPLSGVTAKDETDGDLTKSIKVEGTVDTVKAGTYTLTYTVSDKAGNTATVTRAVTVKAKSEPSNPDQPSQPSEPSEPSEPEQPSEPSVTAVPVYRVYNRNSGLHHYTTSKAERDALVKLGWRDEGTSFKAVKADASNKDLKPVYREYNPNDGNHNWTMNKTEHNQLVKLGWKDEGVAWYVDATAGVDVYRLYNPNSGEHVYTTSKVEYDKVGAAGWRQEGVAWQSLK